MSRNVLALGILVPLVAVGMYGVFKPGPRSGEEPEVVTGKLCLVPREIGPWSGVDRSVKESTLRGAEARAYLYRDYRNEMTREVISVLVLYGEPAALGAHTPERCYAAVGYTQCGPSGKVTLPEIQGESKIEFWHSRFERGRAHETVEVAWGWGADGEWEASENPRLSYAAHNLIYKIYAQRSVSTPAQSESGLMTVFLSQFTRELNRVVRDRSQ